MNKERSNTIIVHCLTKSDLDDFSLALWDSFLELRIKLQRATITCNCLPTTTTIANDDELREVIDESKSNDFLCIAKICSRRSDAKLFRKTLALLLAIETRRSNKRSHDEESDSDTTEVFKTLSKRLKHGEQTIDNELNQTYERFVPKR